MNNSAPRTRQVKSQETKDRKQGVKEKRNVGSTACWKDRGAVCASGDFWGSGSPRGRSTPPTAERGERKGTYLRPPRLSCLDGGD